MNTLKKNVTKGYSHQEQLTIYIYYFATVPHTYRQYLHFSYKSTKIRLKFEFSLSFSLCCRIQLIFR
jgi:hypothetical protein